MSRFEKQINLKGFGEEGQNKLKQSSVLVVGAGGLGAPVLMYLAAAGVGTIGIVDGDTVSVSNLNRQTLFGINDVGKSKVETAKYYLQQKYNDIQIEIYNEYLTTKNCIDIIAKYDLVLDCCDNFTTRYMLNDACVLVNKPLVYGAIFGYEGQVSSFNIKLKNGYCCNYRDLFPIPPTQIPDCNDTGVIGVLPGIIGTLQATEAIKYLTNIGNTLANQILIFNLKSLQFDTLQISPNPDAINYIPKNISEFQKINYYVQCAAQADITWNEAERLYKEDTVNSIFVDVRESDELPKLIDFEVAAIPLSLLNEKHSTIQNKKQLLVFCRQGKRSTQAVSILKEKYPDKDIFSIAGGIMSYKIQS